MFVAPETAKKCERLFVHISLIAAKFPQLKMVIEDIDETAKFLNVYFKLSVLISEIPFYSLYSFNMCINHCLAVFGATRCMFGTNWPVCKIDQPCAAYTTVVKLLKVQPPHRGGEVLIFFQNVIDFYDLEA